MQSFISLILFTLILSELTFAKTFNSEMFAERRQKLMAIMDGGIAIFTSAKVANRNGDVDYEFRQDSDFYYLSGFEEPESAFLLIPDAEQEFVMFVRKRNLVKEKWEGKRYGVKGAIKFFGADTAYTIDNLEEMLPNYLRDKDKVYYNMTNDEFTDKLISFMKNRWKNPPQQIIDPSQYVHEMRLIKSPQEIELLRRSIEITCDAHIEAMKAAKAGMYEYEIAAIIDYIYGRNGCPRAGFPSIIGSGPNSTILHYEANNRRMQNGDVVVMDIGAEYDYYSADVTRTIPVNGKFTKEQKEIYEIVLEAQQAGIDMAAPGIGIGEIRNKIADVMKEGMYRLGLITDRESRWQSRVWYMHGPCHWLGLEVHDVGDYRGNDNRGRILEPGMVTTVEPGLYVDEKSLTELPTAMKLFAPQVPEEEISAFIEKVRPIAAKYANIGVRIEDDIVITESGHEMLSAKAPRQIKEIEKLMKKSSYVNK